MLPFIGVPDQICPECSKTHKDTARVICRQCAKKGKPVTICRLVPKVLENGYYIRPNAVLHSSACNVCQRGLTESSVIEIEDWERTLRPKKIIISPR